jgi:hypothetical protein
MRSGWGDCWSLWQLGRTHPLLLLLLLLLLLRHVALALHCSQDACLHTT